MVAAGVLTSCVVFAPAAAGATGTISIQHHSGVTSTYRDVEIKVISGSLFLTSDDGDGTIVVTRAACSYRDKIIVCLPTAAALVQEGETNALNLKTGTIYLNYTNVEQPLTQSSAKLPANSVMLTLSTNNGTYINVRGHIDLLINQ
jgi:hypothetical protein